MTICTNVRCAFSDHAITELILQFTIGSEMQKILNWREACHTLSISRPTLYKLTNEGALKRVQISPGRVGWPESEIQHFIETRLTEAEMPSDNGSI